MNPAKALAELRKPCAKRTIGHDRDPLGFTLLVMAAPEDAPGLPIAELPAKIDCLTCRFQDRQWAGEPCHTCLDDYRVEKPYPKWRRSP